MNTLEIDKKTSVNYISIMKKSNPKSILQKLLYILIGIFIFYAVFNYLLLPWYVYSAEVNVPKVIGLSVKDAIEKLENSDLEPILGDTVFNRDFKKGTIMYQKPLANDIVKKGRRIYLMVSGGEPMVTVPGLIGKSVTDAKLSLERVGLKLGEITYISSNTPKDVIISQEFAPGYSVKKGLAVGVSISLGMVEGNIEVPNLIGKPLSEAEQILLSLELKPGKLNFQPSSNLLPNTVIDQYPLFGTKLNKGDKVDLFITKQSDKETEELPE